MTTSIKTVLIGRVILFIASVIGIIWVLTDLITDTDDKSRIYALIFFIVLVVILAVTGGITYTKTRRVRTVRTRTTSS